MAERKAVNKYYPPDYNPSKGSLNKYHGTHALRERARKLSQGILIIRFEMPYNIWCDGCGNHIGMGVRYNAEKKKVGMYYSTPIYQFRMKCHLCNNHFEMKTDPQNFDYVVVSGARRQERRWDPTENEQVVPEDKVSSAKLVTDAMFKLEHGVDDMGKSKMVAPVLARLEDFQDRWRDDFAANQLLRHHFRSSKKELQKKEEKDNNLLKKSSLNIKLVEESDQDIRLANLLTFSQVESYEEKQKQKRNAIHMRPLFDSSSVKSEKKLESLVSSVKKSSKASTFLSENDCWNKSLNKHLLVKSKSENSDSKLSKHSDSSNHSILRPDSENSSTQKKDISHTNYENVQKEIGGNISLVSSEYGLNDSD